MFTLISFLIMYLIYHDGFIKHIFEIIDFLCCLYLSYIDVSHINDTIYNIKTQNEINNKGIEKNLEKKKCNNCIININ
jgi:hypothetical protein